MSYILKIIGFVVGIVLFSAAAMEPESELVRVSRKLSRGKKVTLSPDQITYSQTLQSLDVQWADMTLVDDPTGIGKFVGRLGQYRSMMEPYFYKVSKENVTFHFLGAMHTVPLSLLPPFVAEKFSGCSALWVEGRSPASEEEERKDIERYHSSNFSWFEQLTPQQQRHLHLHPGLTIQDPIRLDVRVALPSYAGLHNRYGMDEDLVRSAVRQKKPIHQLEDAILDLGKGEVKEVEEKDREGQEKSLVLFKRVLQTSLEHGGYLNVPEEIWDGMRYLLGWINGNGLFAPPYLAPENQRWFSRLKENSQDGMGVVIGLGHLIDYINSKSLLSYFAEDGWRVQRYDRDGNLTSYPAPK